MLKTVTIETLFGPETTTRRIKPIKFKQIKAVMETLEVREEVIEYLTPDRRYTEPAQIGEIFSFLARETKEYFFTMHLDGKNRILCLDCVSIGSLNQSVVHPREVFKTALLSSAACVVLIHNHPTGDPTPSNEDIAITRRLKESGDILGVKILDHIVIGSPDILSFVERGLL